MKNENKNGVQESINKSRRKLSKTGLAAPVLLSLTSKPSWAFVCTFSGAMSGNLSVERAGFVCDSGIPATKSPGYYKTESHWPLSTCGLVPGTKFNAAFADHHVMLTDPTGLKKDPSKTKDQSLTLTPDQMKDPSILDVLLNNSNVVLTATATATGRSKPKPPMGDNAAAFHFAAALISACADNSTTAGVQIIFPFTAEQIRTAWTNQDREFLAQLKVLQKGGYTVEEAAAKITW
jgi:hypothetical protein